MENEEEKKQTDVNSSTPMADDARAAAAEVRAATEALKAENDRKEALSARESLGGSSEAGKAPVIPETESAKEYAEKVMGGNFTNDRE